MIPPQITCLDPLTKTKDMSRVLDMNWTGNYVGRCTAKGCKHSTFREGSYKPGDCPEHGAYRIEQVIGVEVPEVKCNARCTGAVGAACDCSCGGHNHGTGHAA